MLRWLYRAGEQEVCGECSCLVLPLLWLAGATRLPMNMGVGVACGHRSDTAQHAPSDLRARDECG
jgi:hypothetical protein